MKIEGKNAVLEAIKSGTTIDKILCQKDVNHEIISLARQNKIKVQYVDKFTLDKNSGEKKHQGFIAYVSEFSYSSLEEILQNKKERHFIVLLDGVEDPHNLGSILRVGECAGVDGLVIPLNRSVSVTDTVVRVSAGASNHVKVARVNSINNVIEKLKKLNIWIYCLEAEGQSIYQTDLSGDIAFVIGGEGKGVSSLTKKLCDATVSLPMFGKINSLNASVACGIALYEAVRRQMP